MDHAQAFAQHGGAMFIPDDTPFETVSTQDIVNRFESQIRPIVFALRESLEEQIFADSPNHSVQAILQNAPVDLCIQLADVWNSMRAVGLNNKEILNRFDPTEQFIIEMVDEMYSDSKCDLTSLQNAQHPESSFVRSLSVN
jgi:hypothetical protein